MYQPLARDQLEQRRLLAITFAFVDSHGTLSVIGTGKNDVVTVETRQGKIVVKVASVAATFAGATVKRVTVNGFGGNDSIANHTALPSTLLGSGGNDTLVGGSGDDQLDGGDGHNLLRPGDGDNTGAVDVAADSLD